MFQGKVELFQDDTFLTDGSGQTTLLASAGTAVIVVHHNQRCCFQTVPLRDETVSEQDAHSMHVGNLNGATVRQRVDSQRA